MRYLTLLVALSSSCASNALAPRLVRDLPGNVYDGQHIRAFGYLNVDFENVQLGYSVWDAEGLIRSGPWLDLLWSRDKEKMTGWALVEGTVDLNDSGHMGAFPFTLRDIRIIKRYPDYHPDHPDVDRALKIIHQAGPLGEKDIEELRSLTGHDAGPIRMNWRHWIWDEENPWREERIDRAVILPDDLANPGK